MVTQSNHCPLAYSVAPQCIRHCSVPIVLMNRVVTIHAIGYEPFSDGNFFESAVEFDIYKYRPGLHSLPISFHPQNRQFTSLLQLVTTAPSFFEHRLPNTNSLTHRHLLDPSSPCLVGGRPRLPQPRPLWSAPTGPTSHRTTSHQTTSHRTTRHRTPRLASRYPAAPQYPLMMVPRPSRQRAWLRWPDSATLRLWHNTSASARAPAAFITTRRTRRPWITRSSKTSLVSAEPVVQTRQSATRSFSAEPGGSSTPATDGMISLRSSTPSSSSLASPRRRYTVPQSPRSPPSSPPLGRLGNTTSPSQPTWRTTCQWSSATCESSSPKWGAADGSAKRRRTATTRHRRRVTSRPRWRP
ncbi:hypothetical protein GGR56DRAFT_614606 [Xylariaceae sp. FL0804]|nr:hypothetical protein GGR56DRAFT_614606 [Xylariaceae sp. FL0804]